MAQPAATNQGTGQPASSRTAAAGVHASHAATLGASAMARG